MGSRGHSVRHPVHDGLRVDADTLDEVPREGLLNQKLSLFTFFNFRSAKVCRSDSAPVDLVEMIELSAELRIHRSSVRQ